jgi:hypothetical protein
MQLRLLLGTYQNKPQMKNLHTSINSFAVFAANDRPTQKRRLPHRMFKQQHKNQ